MCFVLHRVFFRKTEGHKGVMYVSLVEGRVKWSYVLYRTADTSVNVVTSTTIRPKSKFHKKGFAFIGHGHVNTIAFYIH